MLRNFFIKKTWSTISNTVDYPPTVSSDKFLQNWPLTCDKGSQDIFYH